MKNLLYILFLFSVQFAFAQSELPEGFGDYRTIPKEYLEEWKPYAQAYYPPEFEKIVWRDSILLLKNNQDLIKNLTEGTDYEILIEIVEICPEFTTWTFEQPKIDTIRKAKKKIIHENFEQVNNPNLIYKNGDTIIERINIQTSTTTIIPCQKQLNPNCLYSKKQYVIWCNLEYPGIYVKVTKIVHKEQNGIWLKTLPDTIYYTEITYKSDFFYKSIKEIKLAKIDTIQIIKPLKKLLLQNAIYSTIYQEKIDRFRGFTEWQEIFCRISYIDPNHILNVQKALKARGYEVKLTNRWNISSDDALLQFQKDNNLPQGQIDGETLSALGLGTVSKIQKALKEKGYDVELTNKFDNKTKKALIQFQKDNNLNSLPQDILNSETFKALGLY